MLVKINVIIFYNLYFHINKYIYNIIINAYLNYNYLYQSKLRI